MNGASTRKEIRRLEKAEALAALQRKDVIRALMSNASGRTYVWNELSAAHVFQTCFAIDPLQMAFLEGERNTGLRMLTDILDACPEEFTTMIREQNERSSIEQQSGSQNSGWEPDGQGDSSYDDPDDDNTGADSSYDNEARGILNAAGR